MTSKSIVKHQYIKQASEIFLDSLDTINAKQIVDFPTRDKYVLELLLTSKLPLLNKCQDIPGPGDHQSAVFADIDCHQQKQAICRTVYICKRVIIEVL